MDAWQMIEAGADAKLTAEKGSARWTFDENNPAHYHYGRQAMHNILYTIANSKVMNGAMPGSAVFTESMPNYQKILIAVDVVAALIVAALAWFIVRGLRKKKKGAVRS